ncbi:hypothetical protein ES705_02407 [subsurface metagenome]|nr:hypothetical protein [Clostridia bacterium]
MLQKKASINLFILLAVIYANPIGLFALNTDQFYLCQNVVNPAFVVNINCNILTCPQIIFDELQSGGKSSLESLSDKLAYEIQITYNVKNRHVFKLTRGSYHYNDFHYSYSWSDGTLVKKETVEIDRSSFTNIIYQYNFSSKFASYFRFNDYGEHGSLGMVYTQKVIKSIRLSSEINFSLFYYIPYPIKLLGGVLIKPYRNIIIPLEIGYHFGYIVDRKGIIALTGIDYDLSSNLRLGLKYIFLNDFHITQSRFGANLSFFLN